MRGVRFLAGAGQVGVEGWRPTSGRWPSSIPARSMIEGHRTPGARPAPDRLFARRINHRGSPGRRRPQCHGAGLVERLVETTHARELKLFAGKLDLSKLGFAEKASVRMAHASEGDYRDWQAIDDWAAAIAQQLQQGRIGAGGPDARA